jgi:hypothetical protein
VSALTWRQAVALERRLGPERMHSELLWSEVTGKTASLPPLPATWRSPPSRRDRRSRGRHLVVVERKTSPRMLLLPDGRRIAGSRRTIRTTITV